MKKYINIIFPILFFISCEEVVNIEVPIAAEKLVIEASLDWEKGTTGSNQIIKLSATVPYFNETINKAVTTASVKVINTNTGNEFLFNNNNDGSYSTDNFVPILNNIYNLEIVYNNEVFTATETLLPTPEINSVTQSTDGGFDDELIEVNFSFNDPSNTSNYYMARFKEDEDLFPQFMIINDDFVNGNEIDLFFEKQDDEDENEFPLEVNDVVNIKFYNISKRYSNYASLLFDQYEGGLFAPTPVEVKGNCTNTTKPDNYPYGYFRITQFEEREYIIN
ncbi:DUF4249 family protein [Tenacibaculum ovolyticum]|uniref:DUF4249 family protein n=1 Tax=Tenacibaculum ovolyticum TaxID=104270 RepID=UPI003BA9DF3A